MSKLDSSCTMMMCGGLLAGAQVASGSVLRRSVATASDSMYPCIISSEIAVTPERENLDT